MWDLPPVFCQRSAPNTNARFWRFGRTGTITLEKIRNRVSYRKRTGEEFGSDYSSAIGLAMSEVNKSEIPDVFILCGGQGTRFREVREDIPKALVPINEVPFLDLLVDDLVDQGCRRIILGTGYLSDQIESHIKQRNDANYLISAEKFSLGTGGAIRNALNLFQSNQVLVLNGDSYIDFSVKTLLHFHISENAETTILLSSGTQGVDYGNVVLDEDHRILSFHEKPQHSEEQLINAGVYCLQHEMIRQQSDGKASIERDWFPQWVCSNRVLGMVIPEPFYDIGTRERFEVAIQKIKRKKC